MLFVPFCSKKREKFVPPFDGIKELVNILKNDSRGKKEYDEDDEDDDDRKEEEEEKTLSKDLGLLISDRFCPHVNSSLFK